MSNKSKNPVKHVSIRVDRDTIDMANDLCNLYKTTLTGVIRQAILRLWQNEQPLLNSRNKKNGQSEETT